MLSLLGSGAAYAEDHQQYKATDLVEVKGNAWTDVPFGDKLTLNPITGRGLYSVQVSIRCYTGTKPRYVKVRLARVLAGGKLDTTATNTYVWTKRGPSVLYASTMWQIKGTHPVKAQIKIVGGTCRTLATRQLKVWAPNPLPTETG